MRSDCLKSAVLLFKFNFQKIRDIFSKTFRITGVFVAKHPIVCLVLSTFVTALSSVGFAKLHVHENMKTGYTSVHAPSRKEYEIYKEFFESGGEPYISGIFITAKSGANLLENDYFGACKSLYDRVVDNLTVLHGGKSYTFSTLCQSHCQINRPVWIFKVKSALKSKPISHLSYPVATVSSLQLNIAPYFHGVSLDQNDTISHVSMLSLWFRSEQSAKLTHILSAWELALYNYISTLDNPLLKVVPYGEHMINAEVLRGGLSSIPYYTLGITAMLVFVMLTLSCGSACRDHSTKCKGLLGFAMVLSPVLASIVTFGFISFLGFHLNVMSLVTPFLVLAIGVDDAFLLIHSWKRHRAILSSEQRLGLVFSEVGPSIAVTSLTNSLAFGIGAAVPTPELRLFCLGAALAMALDFVFQLFFFSAVLALCAPKERKKFSLEKVNKVQDWISSGLTAYCHTLSRWWARLLAAVSLLIYLFIAFLGIRAMRSEMDAKMLLPKDSALLEAVAMHEQYLWKEYQQVTVIVNSVPDISNSTSLAAFEQAVHAFETLPQSLGANVTFLWLRDYLAFERSFDDFLGFLGDGDLTVDYDSLPDFLEFPLYRHWSESVSWRKENDTVLVEKFLFRTAYGNLTTMGQQAQLLGQLRRVAAQHQEFNLSIWEPGAPMCDVILAVRDVTTRTVVITLGCMALVCILFVPNIWSMFGAIGAVASICVGVVGFLHWWGTYLDPITMAFTIMAVGFSVDYTTHISYHFYKISQLEGQSQSKFERLYATLDSVAWPMVQAGLSTVICLFPLAFAPLPAYVVLLKTVTLVVILGLWHGLFLVPVLLAALPEQCIGAAKTERIMLDDI